MRSAPRRVAWLCLLVATLTLLNVITLTAQDPIDTSDDSIRESLREAILQDQNLPDVPNPLAIRTPTSKIECENGFAGIFPCEGIDLLANLPLTSIGGTADGNDIWGWTDPLTGKEYAVMGHRSGTAFVDVSDPENPLYLGLLPTHTSNTLWRDVKVYANHAYIVSEAGGHGMQIFDLTQLRSVSNPPVTFAETAHYDQFGSAHNIVINEASGFAYAVGGNCGGGLHMIDLQNPASPSFAGCFSADGYTHDAQCVIYNGPDTSYQGQEICFNSNADTLTIVNVNDKNNPVQLARQGYAGSRYAHQGWLTEDHRYFLMGDELDESGNGHNTRTYIWDVSDLTAPSFLGFYTGPTPAIDHNLYIKGDLVYEANYRAGLRVLELTDPSSATLTEIAYFDTFPSNDSPNYNGAWSVYPYFESGTIIVSDIDRGLFVLRFTEDTFNLTTTPAEQAICQGEPATYAISLTASQSFSDTISLSLSDAPAGASITFADNPITLNGQTQTHVTTTLTLDDVSAGQYSFIVHAQGTTQTLTSTNHLAVTAGSPAAVSLQSPADEAEMLSTQPVFSWTNDLSASTYQLEIATDPDFSEVVYSVTTTEAIHEVTSLLDHNGTYYWRVSPANICGAGGSSAVFSFTTEPAPGQCTLETAPVDVYRTDFELGATGWLTGGLNSTWQLSEARTNSGTAAFFADNLNEEGDQQLTSPAIELPAASGPLSLQFWHYRHLEGGSTNCYDGGILEISTNGGDSWAQVESEIQVDPYDNPINLNYDNPLAGQMAWCGDSDGWRNSIADLGAYAGETVHLRWRLGTDRSSAREGWYVDDVLVQSCQLGPRLEAQKSVATGQPENWAIGGQSVTYTLSFSNTGNQPAQQVILTDSLPNALSFGGWLGGSGSAQLLGGETIGWGPFDVPPGVSYTLRFTATLSDDPGFAGQSITNTLTASSQSDEIVTAEASLRVNQPPLAQSDHFTTSRNVTLTVFTPGVLGNDSDLDGQSLQAHLHTAPLAGSLNLADDGGLVYQPALDFVGAITFSYTAFDGLSHSAPAWVTVTVAASNTAPLAEPDTYTFTAPSLSISAPGVLGNDSDPDQNNLQAILVDGPLSGSLVLAGDGSFIYTPTAAAQLDRFTYRASDGSLSSPLTTVTLRLHTPTANSTTLTLEKSVAGPAMGTLQSNQDFVLTYTLSLSNSDLSPATAVILSDTLPAELSFGGAVSGPAPTVNGATLTWGPLNVADGNVEQFSFTATLNTGTALNGQIITNTAFAQADNAPLVQDSASYQLPQAAFERVFLPLVLK